MGKFDNLQKTLWILIYCKSCGHCRDVDESFCKTFATKIGVPLDKLSQLDFDKHASEFQCAECGGRGARVEIKKKGKRVQELRDIRVATWNSVGRTFHRPKCRWMSRVSAVDEIRFKDRQAAMDRGFTACKNCRP